MISEEIRSQILDFFESIDQYYGCKTEIVEGIHLSHEADNAQKSTWNLSEFTLIRSAYRNTGEHFMLEGEKMYYEISAAKLVDFKQTKRHSYELMEQYADSVFRITKFRFHSKY
mgnify:CR=1 FL=1